MTSDVEAVPVIQDIVVEDPLCKVSHEIRQVNDGVVTGRRPMVLPCEIKATWMGVCVESGATHKKGDRFPCCSAWRHEVLMNQATNPKWKGRWDFYAI